MNIKHRRTEVQIETHEVRIIRLRKKSALALCEVCVDIVPAMTVEQTAQVLELTQNEIFRLVKDERIHLVSSQIAFTLVCGNSFGSTNDLRHGPSVVSTCVNWEK